MWYTYSMDGEERYYDVVEVMARDALARCVNTWGIEKTEDKIKEICSSPQMRPMRDYHLRLFYRTYLGREYEPNE